MGIIASLLSPVFSALVPRQRVYQPTMWPRRNAGVNVNEDNALQYSAFWSCVKIISETMAVLPWHIYRRIDQDNSEIINSPLDWMLYRQINPEISSFTFREIMLAWALTWGNGYAEIEFDLANRPIALWPIAPHRVEVERDENKNLIYRIYNIENADVILPANRIIHLHGLGYDGLKGYSVIAMAAKSLGLGIACEQFGSNYFGNGAHPGIIVTHPKKLSQIGHENLEKSLLKGLDGLDKTHRLLLLEEAMQIDKISFPPNESQFLETRKFQVAEVARWFRMPLHKMSDLDRSTNNNIEQQAIEFVTDTILPWVSRLETETDIKLFNGYRGKRYCKLNLNSLMRGDSKARAEFYQIMRSIGVFSVNDILRLEDMNTIGPEGDKRLVQLAQTTLERIGEEPIAPPPQEPLQNRTFEPLQMILSSSAKDIVSRETKRAKDALERYPDRKDFATWIEGFIENHRIYIRRKLHTQCQALASFYELPEDKVELLMDTLISRHLQMMRDYLFEPNEEDCQIRSKELAGYISDAFKQAALMEQVLQ